MRVLKENPPLFEEITKSFPISGRDIIFAWGDTIYCPSGGNIPRQLLAHEEVHGKRQGTDVLGWWGKYLVDPEFRFSEELPAHIAELKCYFEFTKDRNSRAVYLSQCATRLASPLYGGLVKFPAAMKLLREAS